jgi:hypothetical protein
MRMHIDISTQMPVLTLQLASTLPGKMHNQVCSAAAASTKIAYVSEQNENG